MTNYTKAVDFAAKDSLSTGNSAKIVKGTEIDTEFNAISTAIATKSNIAGPTFTGNVTIPTATISTVIVPDASDGATIGSSSLEFSDLYLADGALIYLGNDQDTTLTHVADTGILLNSTRQLQFGDSGTYIHQSADGVLDLVSDTEIELTATTIDINGAVAMDGAITGGTNITISGELDAATLDISGNADIDGTLEADAYTVAGTALNEYIADTVGAMVSSNTETNITVTYEDADNTLDFVVGTLNQDTTGLAATATALATARTIGGTSFDGTGNIAVATATEGTNVTVSANNSTDETVYPTFVDGATGTQGIETDTGLTYNPSTGMLTSTGVTSTFTGNITGNVTGNTSGTAATVTTAAQSNITSLGTLTTLTVDNVIINGSTIGHTGDTDLITVASGIATVAGEVSMTTLDIGGTNVTSTAEELNILDGVTSTAAELNILDGVTSTTAELNILDGVTSTAAELNILDGVTSTAAELNILDGVTSTAAEINALDGITAVVGELNALDIGSTAVGTAVASKAVILDSNKDYTGVRNLTISGELDAGSLDISNDIDVDGTANLDIVDIDGAVDMASTLAVAGVSTFAGGLTVPGGIVLVGGVTNTAGGYTFKVGGSDNQGELAFTANATAADLLSYDRTNSHYNTLNIHASSTIFTQGAITSNTLNSASGNDLRLNAGSANRDVFFQVNGSTLATLQGSSGSLLVGTTAEAGAIDNSNPVTAGRFRTMAGVASAADNTATTLVTLPAGFATYLVNAGFNGINNAGAYGATAIVHTDGSTNSITQLVNPSNMTISMSGMAVQGTHTGQGATLNISFSVLRM